MIDVNLIGDDKDKDKTEDSTEEFKFPRPLSFKLAWIFALVAIGLGAIVFLAIQRNARLSGHYQALQSENNNLSSNLEAKSQALVQSEAAFAKADSALKATKVDLGKVYNANNAAYLDSLAGRIAELDSLGNPNAGFARAASDGVSAATRRDKTR